MGRKRLIISGLSIVILVQIILGCLIYLTYDTTLFLSVSIITRILSGMSRSMHNLACYSYVSVFWSDTVQQKLGILEGALAVGTLCGPLFGSAFNYALGYSAPFYIVAGILFILLWPIAYHLPSDKSIGKAEMKKSLPIGSAFKSIKIIITIINNVSITSAYFFVLPILVNHCSTYGYIENVAAIFMALPALIYIAFCYVVPKLSEHLQKSFLMSFASLICCLGNSLEGALFGDTDYMLSTTLGLLLVGIAYAFSMLPSIPQMADILKSVIVDKIYENYLTDIGIVFIQKIKYTTLFLMSLSLGQLIGQLLGGTIYDKFGGNVDVPEDPSLINQERDAFRNSFIVLCIWQLTSGCLFFFFGDGYKGWKMLFIRKTIIGQITQRQLSQIETKMTEENIRLQK